MPDVRPQDPIDVISGLGKWRHSSVPQHISGPGVVGREGQLEVAVEVVEQALEAILKFGDFDLNILNRRCGQQIFPILLIQAYHQLGRREESSTVLAALDLIQELDPAAMDGELWVIPCANVPAAKTP